LDRKAALFCAIHANTLVNPRQLTRWTWQSWTEIARDRETREVNSSP